MANATSTELQELYIAYFGRAADPTGLDYWVEKGTTTSAFAATQHAQPEFKDVYGSLSTEAQVNQIYKNLFDRAADVDGLTYWTQQINLGNLELAEIAVHLIWAAKNNSGSESDKTALSNRTSAAVAYTAEVKLSTSAILAYAPENDGKDADADWVSGDNITEAVEYLSGIDATTEYTAAGITTSVNKIIANGTQNDKKTFVLTTGLNNFKGGDSSDTFDASTALSLNNGDTLDGGGGTDTITAKFSQTTTAVNSKNIEKFVITATGTTTLNFADTTGVTSISNQGSTAGLTINSLNSIPTYELNTNAQVNAIEFADAALSGTADEFKVTLSGTTNATAGDNAETLTITRAAGATNDLETLHLVSSTVANLIETVTTTAVDTTKLVVSGDQNLTIEDSVGAEITTVDASDATGDVTVITGYTGATTVTGGSGSDSFTTSSGADTISGGAGNDILDGGSGNDTIDGGAGNDTLTSSGTASLTGGAGNDTFKLTAAAITADSTYKGGDGTDGFEFTTEASVADADFGGATSIEEITFTEDVKTALTLGTKAAATGINKITNNSDAGENGLITVGIDFTNDLEIVLNHSQDDITASSFTKVLTVDANTVELATTNSIVGGSGTDDVFEFNGTNNSASITDNVTGFENFKVNKDATSSFLFADASGGAAGDIVIDGTAITSTDKVFTIDAKAEADANVTIKGGAGNDVISITQSTAGGDSVTGGTGNDRLIFTSSYLTSADTIDGGAGTDSLEVIDDNAFIDADFTNVSNVENIQSAISMDFAATLSTYAAAAGITTVTLKGVDDDDDLTVEAGFTNDLTVVFDSGTNRGANDNDDSDIVATNYTGVLTVNATGSTLSSTNDITGGTGTSDVLLFSGTGNAATNISAITKIETFKANTDASASILVDQANAATDESLHVDGSSLVSVTSVFTVDAKADTDAKISITGGAGNDVITISNGAETDHGDTVTGGAGNDTFKFANGKLTKTDTIKGGAGTDILEGYTDGTTVADIDFTGVTSVETFTITAGSQLTKLTLDSIAAAAGIDKVVLTADAATHTVNVTSGFSNNLTIDPGSDALATIAINASVTTSTAYSGVLNITAAGSELDTRVATITGGSGTSDVITISGGGAPVMTSISKVEKVTFSASASAGTVTLVDGNAVYTNGSSYETITVDASALTGVATIDADAETDSKVIIIGGSGADIINASTSSNFGESIDGGSGNDTILITGTSGLSSTDTIDGGAGTDTLRIHTTATTLADVDFTNLSNIEVLDAANGNNAEVTVTLGAQADEAGITSVIHEGNEGGSVTVLAAFDNALSVELNGEAVSDKVDASAASNVLTVKTIDSDFTAGDTVKGGTGTSDSIEITAGGGTATTTLMTGIETITIKDGGATTVTMGANDLQIASGKTLTVNASALTASTRTLTFNGTASETDGFLNITGGAQADSITGGASNDTISGGTGADSITGGDGSDSITGGGGADIFVYSAVADSTSNDTDFITDWTTGTDKMNVTLNYSSISSALNINATVLTAAAGTTAVQDSLSGKRGEYIYDKTNEKLIINFNGDNLVTTQDYVIKIAEASTEANSVVTGDLNFSITGTTGDDTIAADGGADTIAGGSGADSITAGAGADSITGAAGADTINAGSGADTITGGAGADSIVLGTGIDKVIFSSTGAANGTDTITSYSEGASGDILDFGAFLGIAAAENTTSSSIYTAIAAATSTVSDTDVLTVDDNFIIVKGAATDYDTTTEVADLFDASTNANGAFKFSAGSKVATLIIGANTATTGTIWAVACGTNAAVADTEVTQIGSITSSSDFIDLMHTDNIATG